PAVTGTSDWQTVSLQFDGTGFRRFKIVLEHTGPGQSWFDNVELRADASATGRGWHDGALDWRGRDWSRPQRIPHTALRCSRPQMLEDGRRLVMAWRDCSAAGPQLILPRGTYRLLIRAAGDGCAEDLPSLQVKAGEHQKTHAIALD